MINEWLLVLPVLVPLLSALFCFLIREKRRNATTLTMAGSFSTLMIALALTYIVIEVGPQAVSLGQWPAPFGIAFAADILSVMLLLTMNLVGFLIIIYASADLYAKRSYGFYLVLIQIMMAGVNGALLTTDVFNLYVWFELMLIASFGLMVLDANAKSIDGAVKYVVLNLVSTLLFLTAIGLLYGATGTLNMADLHAKIQLVEPSLAQALAALFLFAFAIKSSLFPVFAWLPASYHVMASSIVALFAGMLTKVGVYVMIRVFTLIFPIDLLGYQDLLAWVAGLTMFVGVLFAASQMEIKRILSVHIVSQIGYMIMGLAIYTPLAIAGAIFYVMHNVVVKANLFLIGGVLNKRYGSDCLSRLGGAYMAYPGLAFMFIIAAFSLAGFPPSSGFWGKFTVIGAGLQSEYYWLSGLALFVSILTLYSMSKIWAAAFWSPKQEGSRIKPLKQREIVLYYTPIAILCVLALMPALFYEDILTILLKASDQLKDPTLYIDAVMAEGRRIEL